MAEGSTRLLALLNGGPCDGDKQVVNGDTFVMRLALSDGSNHLYERAARGEYLPDGQRALMFHWRGYC